MGRAEDDDGENDKSSKKSKSNSRKFKTDLYGGSNVRSHCEYISLADRCDFSFVPQLSFMTVTLLSFQSILFKNKYFCAIKLEII